MPKGRYRNVNPSAIALLFGGPKPANKLKLALARAEEPAMDDETAPDAETPTAPDAEQIPLDADQLKLVKRALTAGADEAKLTEAAAALSDEEKAALVAASRLAAGIDREVVARAMDCQGMHCPACGEKAATEQAAQARALEGLPAEVVARMQALTDEVATQRAAVAAERAVREKAEVLVLARAELAHLMKEVVAKLTVGDIVAIAAYTSSRTP